MATDDEANERFRRGREVLGKLAVDTTSLFEAFDDVCPALARAIVEFNYGDLYARSDLGLRDRELLTIACLVGIGDTSRQVRRHAEMALACGVTPSELVEAVLNCAPYAGFPRVINAMLVVRDVLDERSLLPLGDEKGR